MEKKAIELMTAQEARQLASTSTVLIKRVSKVIKDCAAEGHTRLVWSDEDLSSVVVDNLKNYLESKGYSVNIKTDIYDNPELALAKTEYIINIVW